MNPQGSPAVVRVFGERRFHADGEVLALALAGADALWSIEENGVLRQWNLANGQQLQHFSLNELETLWTFSHDAHRLASASDDLSIWDTFTGDLATTLEQPSWVTALAFGRDPTRVATGHDDSLVRIWDTETGKLLHELHGHELPISALAFGPGDFLLATAAEDRLIHIWETTTGRLLGTLPGHTDRIPALTWHPDGMTLVSAGWDNTARVWDLDSFEPIILLNTHAEQVTAIAFRPDGNLLACADSAFAIHIWDPATWQTLHILRDHTDEIHGLAFSRDGRLLVSGGTDRVIRLWDPQQGRSLTGSGTSHRHRIGVMTTASGLRLASCGGGLGLRLWDPNRPEPVLVSPADQALQALACTPSGRRVAGALGDGSIQFWDADTGQPLATVMGQTNLPTVLAFSPDGNTLAAASATDGTVWLWDVATAEPRLLLPESVDGCSVEALAFHPQGQGLACGGIDWLATGGSDGAVCLWDQAEGQRLALLDGGSRDLAFDPSGHWLAVASLNETIWVWDVEQQRPVHELNGLVDAALCVAFHPEGKYLAAGSEGGRLCFWSLPGFELKAAHDLDTPLQSLAFSTDGRFLFTGNGNTTCYQLEVDRLVSG